MRCTLIVSAFLCIPSGAFAQAAIPAGTILPVSLDTSLNAATAHQNEKIRATVMQDVPGTSIRRREKVEGEVVRVGTAQNGQVQLAIRFDAVKVNDKKLPIQTNLRALASFFEVEEAQIPEDMSSRGLTPETWTTQQIGGDQVYRGGGPVAAGITPVGQVTPWGALDVPRAQTGEQCRGTIGANSLAQAMWLFSSDSCGVYGFTNIHIEHAGRSAPAGTIVLSSTDGKLKLGSGTAFLLRASSPETPRSEAELVRP